MIECIWNSVRHQVFKLYISLSKYLNKIFILTSASSLGFRNFYWSYHSFVLFCCDHTWHNFIKKLRKACKYFYVLEENRNETTRFECQKFKQFSESYRNDSEDIHQKTCWKTFVSDLAIFWQSTFVTLWSCLISGTRTLQISSKLTSLPPPTLSSANVARPVHGMKRILSSKQYLKRNF